MSPHMSALAAALMVLAAAATAAPRRHVRRLVVAPAAGPDPSPVGPITRLGAALRRRLGGDVDPSRDQRAGWLAIVCLLTLAVSPALTVVVVAAAGASSVIRRRRQNRWRQRDLVDELPDVVDLLLLAVSAGHTVPLAVAVVADHGRGQLASELDQARQGTAVGSRLADELDLIPARLGEPVRPLMRALAGSLRDGAPLGPALERVATDVRTQRRRAAEERARRVSVRLLFPLVCCTLPAFGLLTVVPLLVTTLRGMSV